MATITRWKFEIGGTNYYLFPRNPDRYGGDTYWNYESRHTELDVIGAATPTIQVHGFRGARRAIRFTAIPGYMMRVLQDFYLRHITIRNCRDHLYPDSPQFGCFVESFSPNVHPTVGNFPGTGEDTWDLEIELLRVA